MSATLEVDPMPKNLAKPKSPLEDVYRHLIGPTVVSAPTMPDNLGQPDRRVQIVSVTTYGAFEAPIEGWSNAYAKLGASIK